MKTLLYEGKAKKIFATDNDVDVIIYYKDDATAFNGEKKGQIQDKGMINNKITAFLFALLEKNGIATHFIEQISDREMRAKRVTIIPIEVVVRNIVAGSLVKRLGWPEGTPLPSPIVELYYKDDDLGDPLINDYHIAALKIASPQDITELEQRALKINHILTHFFDQKGITLVDFKLEFGKDSHGNIYLADEISPDTCRFWDKATGNKLDKDRFRRDLGGVEDAYIEMLHRTQGN